MSFWESIWLIIVVFAFVCYLMVLWTIITDLFRDHKLSGWWKAVWVICMFIFPLLTALVYLVARGQGMAERQREAIAAAKNAQDDYIRNVVQQTGPAQQIADAKALLDDGTISQDEFDTIKTKALA
ncbi:SHOCT domain-containing protein [Tomitella cavernea]|uniref:SHOCT domain-containing protein n=1 Tax=Tomitella cavernea TaxID=1387982 RepID=A0ABP9CYU7_9ACTN